MVRKMLQLLQGKSKSTRILQFCHGIALGDAVSDEMFFLRDILQKEGFKSEIYSKNIDVRLKGIQNHKDYVSCPSDILIYHFVTADPHVLKSIKDLPNKKVLIYHNVTPASFFNRYSKKFYEEAKQARKDLFRLSKHFQVYLADSKYNASELRRNGFKDVQVLPIVYNFKRLDSLKQDRTLAKKLSDRYVKNIIFIGRVAPNKCQLDLVKAFYIYNKYVNSLSRLFIIGNLNVTPKYVKEIKGLVRYLGISDVVKLTGHISPSEWITYYRNTDLLLSMSEHEGFFVPAFECMHLSIPMLLYKSTAVPDTAGDAAVYFEKKDFGIVAELMGMMIDNVDLRRDLIKKGKERLKLFAPQKVAEIFLNEIYKLVDNDG